jgi:ABC-2 type transport system permease protein
MSPKRAIGVFYRYFFVLLKGPQQLSDLFYWPLIDILLWGLTSIWIQTQHIGSNLPLILMTGLIFWQITWRGSVDIGVSLLQEFWHRNLINLFSTPLKISEWIGGIIMLCFCKLMVTISFGALAVYVLYSLNVFTVGWAFLPFAVSLLLFGWVLGFLGASFIIYWGMQLEALAWMIGFLFAPFSAVFYPVHVLPEWARCVSWCLPTTYIFEGMRSVLATGEFPMANFVTSIGLNILYLTLSLCLFKFMFNKSLAKGLARLE